MADFPKIAAPVLPGSRSRLPLLLVGTALAFVVASVVAYQQYQGRTQAGALVTSTQQELKAGKAKVAELEAQKAQLEADKEILEAAKAELSKSVEAKEGELSQLKGTYDSFREKMKDEIARGDINLE